MAPFSGLEARFQASAQKLYTKYSPNDKGDGTRTPQPFVTFTPLDPKAEETAHDSYTAPVGSLSRDKSRVAKFLATPDGKVFLRKEVFMQTGNTFGETVALNPGYITDNIPPFNHFQRPLVVASDLPLLGNDGTASPASSDPLIGLAGRLQITTAQAILGDVLANNPAGGLLQALSSTGILATALDALGAGAVASGPEGINKRPELDVNGQWFSISLWHGFQKRFNVGTALASAGADLLRGNFTGAMTQAVGVAKDLVGAATKLLGVGVQSGPLLNNPLVPLGRDNPSTNDYDGWRYFITDPNNADRYMVNSITFTTNGDDETVPVINLMNLVRDPYILAPPPPQPSLFANVNLGSGPALTSTFQSTTDPSSLFSGASLGTFTNQANAQSSLFSNASIGDFVSSQNQTSNTQVQSAVSNLRSPFQSLLNQAGAAFPLLSPVSSFIGSAISSALGGGDPNPGQDDMLFPGLSLEARYQTTSPDDALAFIIATLQHQQEYETGYWQSNQPKMGFVGGFAPTGTPLPIDPQTRNASVRYFHDRLNDVGVMTNTGANLVSNQTINNIQQGLGTDLINVLFYDYVNQKTIPFRAFVTNLQETVNPDIVDTRYIGRIDRNIVYVGVTRELSFGLYVHAMNDTEMPNIWAKINYMTGLCYPADYNHGFMVPPLVRLTIGDFYRDQPGYIRSLTHQLEQDTPWETTPGLQVPHGVLMNCTFTVIERTVMRASSNFYPMGQPRLLPTSTTG